MGVRGGGRPASLLPYGAPLRPAHILSLAYKSNCINIRAWDLNTGLENNHFTELSFPVAAVLAVGDTMVIRAIIVSGPPLQDSADINYCVVDYE
jgi:hypothetical protein